MKKPVSPTCLLGRPWITALALLLVWFWAVPARAQTTDGILVQGGGVTKGRPDQVEIMGTISADAELAADATVKYRDAKKRAISTMDALRNPSLSLDFAGFAINNSLDANTQLMIQRGQAVAPPKGKIQVAENCRIILKDIDKIAPEALMDTLLKIVDTAKDAGFQIGPSSANSNNYYEQQARAAFGNALISFKIADATPLRDAASKAAIDDAKLKAQKLADLAGVKLGRVLAIREASNQASSGSGNTAFDYAIAMLANKTGGDDKALLGNVFGDMAVRVTLTVQFEIVK